MTIDKNVIKQMELAGFSDEEIVAIGNYAEKLIDIAFKNFTIAMTESVFGEIVSTEEVSYEELPEVSDEEWVEAPEDAEIELPEEE